MESTRDRREKRHERASKGCLWSRAVARGSKGGDCCGCAVMSWGVCVACAVSAGLCTASVVLAGTCVGGRKCSCASMFHTPLTCPLTCRLHSHGCGFTLLWIPQSGNWIACVARSFRACDLACGPALWGQWGAQGAVTLTPLNSLAYNLDPANLALHGTHPRWTHVAVNFPLLFGPAALVAVVAIRGT